MHEPKILCPGRAKAQDASTKIKPRAETLYVFMMTGDGDSSWRKSMKGQVLSMKIQDSAEWRVGRCDHKKSEREPPISACGNR